MGKSPRGNEKRCGLAMPVPEVTVTWDKTLTQRCLGSQNTRQGLQEAHAQSHPACTLPGHAHGLQHPMPDSMGLQRWGREMHGCELCWTRWSRGKKHVSLIYQHRSRLSLPVPQCTIRNTGLGGLPQGLSASLQCVCTVCSTGTSLFQPSSFVT